MRLAAALALLAILPGAPAAAGVPPAGAPPPSTRLELADASTGRPILSRDLAEGERAVLEWTNSLFGLAVTEVFVARGGGLVLDGVTFADPGGAEPPRVRPEDVDDLFHTGGPFRAEGLARPVERVVFRVGEAGRPVLRVGDRAVRFLDEVGFGGAILLRASRAAR
jgi:hypothetical protein